MLEEEAAQEAQAIELSMEEADVQRQRDEEYQAAIAKAVRASIDTEEKVSLAEAARKAEELRVRAGWSDASHGTGVFWPPPPRTHARLDTFNRVFMLVPWLHEHPPLVAAAAGHIPALHEVEDRHVPRAVGEYLSTLRDLFLLGRVLPPVPGYPSMALSIAIMQDILAPGGKGLMGPAMVSAEAATTAANPARWVGLEQQTSVPATAPAQPPLLRPRRGPFPLPSPLPSVPESYDRFFRDGWFCACVKQALEGPVSMLEAAQSIGTFNVTMGGPMPVDFGLQRASSPTQTTVRQSAFDALSDSTWTPDVMRTRHVTVENAGAAPVLLLAVTASPQFPGVFRVRCDHGALVRHPGDCGPPVDGQPPVVLPPGASYELSVDLKCGAAHAGSLAQWVLAAVLECPEGWDWNRLESDDGAGSRGGTTHSKTLRDVLQNAFRSFQSARAAVRVVGRRVSALVSASVLSASELTPLLDAEAPKFVPQRLLEAFDNLPHVIVQPPRWSQGSNADTHVVAPAAYQGPRGVYFPRTFCYATNDMKTPGMAGAMEVDTNHYNGTYTLDMEWDAVENCIDSAFGDTATASTLRRWTRLCRVEEAQQARDIQRYDLHDVELKWTSLSYVSGSNEVDKYADTYRFEVPGLIEGFPPVAVQDVLRLRIVRKKWSKKTTETVSPDEREVAALVISVVPRAATVVVAILHCVTRKLNRLNRDKEMVTTFIGHVRFAYDTSLFRAQRGALCAAARCPAVAEMLVPKPSLSHLSWRNYTVGPSLPPSIVAHLNHEQQQVVRDVLNGNATCVDESGMSLGPPYCVLGPPGTGKTMTLVAAAAAVLTTCPNARLLLCAPAAFAADVICSRLVAFSTTTEASHAGMSPLTKGGVPPLTKGDFPPLMKGDFLPPTKDEEKKTRPVKMERRRWTWTIVRVSDPRRDPASVKADVRPFCDDAHSEAALNARVVVASCASAGLLTQTGNRNGFTHIMVDEAGQATVPECLIPMRLVSPAHATSVVLVGDPRQLGPVVHSVVAARPARGAPGLITSMLETSSDAHVSTAVMTAAVFQGGVGDAEDSRASVVNRESVSSGEGSGDGMRRITQLVRNYRSHEDIIKLPSKLFYGNKLMACASEPSTALPSALVKGDAAERSIQDDGDGDVLHVGAGGRVARVIFHGVRGRQAREGRGEAPSLFNAIEAQALVDLLSGWLTRGGDAGEVGGDPCVTLRPEDVGVIAPYRAQVLRLRLLLRGRGLGAVRVGTVDDYQGQEERVIFISTVVSRPPREVPQATSGEDGGDGSGAVMAATQLGFLACPRRFNVAITRAKALNVIVGHPVALCHWPHWHSLLQYCVSRGQYMGSGSEHVPAVASAPMGDQEDLEEIGLEGEDDDGYEDIAEAIGRIAELSLLGGGDGGGMFFDEDDAAMMESAFTDEQAWRVAL